MDRNLNISLSIRNRISTGLAQAKTQLRSFASQSRQLLEAIWAPVTIATSVLAMIKQVSDAFDGMRSRAIKANGAIQSGNAEAYLQRMTRAIKDQDEAYKALTTTMGQQAAAAAKYYDLLVRSEAIQARLATLERLKTSGGTSAARKEIEDEARATQRVVEAQHKMIAAQHELDDTNKQIATTLRERQRLEAELPELEKNFAEASQKSLKAAEQYSRFTSAARSNFSKEQKAAAREVMVNAEKVAEGQFKIVEDQRRSIEALARTEEEQQRKRANLIKQRANAEKEVTLERAEIEAEADQRRIEEEEKATDEAKRIAEKAADDALRLSEKLVQDRARLEKQLADLTLAERRKVLSEEIRAAEQTREQARRTAEQKIRSLLEERRHKKDAQKIEDEEARRAKRLEGSIRRGVRLSRRDADWHDAWRERQAARAQMVQAGARVEQARGEMGRIEGQAELQKLTGIETELKEVNKLLSENLRYQ